MYSLKRLAKRGFRTLSRVRTRWKDELVIQYDELDLHFATRSPIAKRWFYPRYASGRRMHEPPISHLINTILEPNSTFFDVGANLGFFTVLAANRCTALDGAVHAFELDPSLIPLISDSLHLNDHIGTVYLNCVACAGEEGAFCRFEAAQEQNPSTNQIVSDVEPREKRVHKQGVTTTLDHYWRRAGVSPDLIKIDIEGAEALAVPGMLELVKEERPKIILEVHPPQMQKFGASPENVVNQLQKAGNYHISRVDSYRDTHEDGETLVPLEHSILSENHPVVLFFSS